VFLVDGIGGIGSLWTLGWHRKQRKYFFQRFLMFYLKKVTTIPGAFIYLGLSTLAHKKAPVKGL
jgi:hypothetical protein